MEPLVTHVRLEPGRFSPSQTDGRGRHSGVERTAEYWCGRAEQVGPWCGEWAQRVRAERGVEAVRVLMGLVSLAKRVGRPALDHACALAVTAGALRLRDLRRLLEQGPQPQQVTFMEHHPLIRDLGEYGNVVGSIVRQANGPTSELPTAAPAGCEGPSGATMDNSSPARAAGG